MILELQLDPRPLHAIYCLAIHLAREVSALNKQGAYFHSA